MNTSLTLSLDRIMSDAWDFYYDEALLVISRFFPKASDLKIDVELPYTQEWIDGNTSLSEEEKLLLTDFLTCQVESKRLQKELDRIDREAA